MLERLSQYGSEILLLALVMLAVLSFVTFRTASQLSRVRGKWRELLDGQRGENLERLLESHLRERLEMQELLEQTIGRVTQLEDRVNTAKRHLGLVRYDAFEDVGGSQSFALAIYDDRGDGAILNGLVGRTDCRVYCKPLMGGRSERNLSEEEQRAVEEAVRSGPKSIVS